MPPPASSSVPPPAGSLVPPSAGSSVPPPAGSSVPPPAGSSVPPSAGSSVPPPVGSSVPPSRTPRSRQLDQLRSKVTRSLAEQMDTNSIGGCPRLSKLPALRNLEKELKKRCLQVKTTSDITLEMIFGRPPSTLLRRIEGYIRSGDIAIVGMKVLGNPFVVY